MVVIAGPAGSGKSTAFPVVESGVDGFNIDDRAAELNGGSHRNIPTQTRARVNKECEEFIEAHIREGKSFAVETTLRSDITLRQAAAVRRKGFSLQMRYVALEDPETNVERIANRAERGGHSATPSRIREVREAGLKNFPKAVREFDRVRAYDNTRWAERPRLVFHARDGKARYVAEKFPSWLQGSLRDTEYEIRDPESGKEVEK